MACNEEIQNAVTLLSRMLGPEIEIAVDLQRDLPDVAGDPAQFETALVNLAVNARDAMEGRGHILIRTRLAGPQKNDAASAQPVPDQHVVISFQDDGPGMSPEVVRRAFEPLFTTKTGGKGTGFGLAMVYNFARQHGGQARIQSEPGFGTTVQIWLPVDTASIRTVRPVQETTGALPEVGGNRRILLVDDDKEVREPIAEQLRHSGYHVTEADRARQAIDLLERSPDFDLLITDVIMPGDLNGADLASLARERWPDLPVLVITGYPQAALREQQHSLQDFVVLNKPVRRAALLQQVASMLGENNEAS